MAFPDGSVDRRQLDYSYYHPKEHAETSTWSYEFADYVSKLNQAGFERSFRGLYHPISGNRIGSRNPISCDIALFAVSSTRLANTATQLGLDDLDANDVGLGYGVHLAVDGMPTGIRIDDWDNRGHDRKRFHVLVDAHLDLSNQLDSGRKGISRHYAQLISDFVWDRIITSRIGSSDSFGRYVSKYLDHGRTSTTILPPQDFAEKVRDARQAGSQQETGDAELVRRVRTLSSLQYPPTEEQEVISLFGTLLAGGWIKGYRIIYLSGKATYDAALEYELECTPENVHPRDPMGIGDRLVQELRGKGIDTYRHRDLYAGRTTSPELCVEFKLSVGGFLHEVVVRPGRTNKDPSCIDLLVVWDDAIPDSVPSASYSLNPAQPNQRVFHSVTHRLGLSLARSTEIDCIVLKDVVGQLSV